MADQKSVGADVARPALPRDAGPASSTIRASKDPNPVKKKKPVTDEEKREREVNRKLQHQLISHWRMDRKSSRERPSDSMPSSKLPRIVSTTPKAAMNPANALKGRFTLSSSSSPPSPAPSAPSIPSPSPLASPAARHFTAPAPFVHISMHSLPARGSALLTAPLFEAPSAMEPKIAPILLPPLLHPSLYLPVPTPQPPPPPMPPQDVMLRAPRSSSMPPPDSSAPSLDSLATFAVAAFGEIAGKKSSRSQRKRKVA